MSWMIQPIMLMVIHNNRGTSFNLNTPMLFIHTKYSNKCSRVLLLHGKFRISGNSRSGVSIFIWKKNVMCVCVCSVGDACICIMQECARNIHYYLSGLNKLMSKLMAASTVYGSERLCEQVLFLLELSYLQKRIVFYFWLCELMETDEFMLVGNVKDMKFVIIIIYSHSLIFQCACYSACWWK